MHERGAQSIEILRNMRERRTIYRNILKYARVAQNLKEYREMCKRGAQSIGISRNTLEGRTIYRNSERCARGAHNP